MIPVSRVLCREDSRLVPPCPSRPNLARRFLLCSLGRDRIYATKGVRYSGCKSCIPACDFVQSNLFGHLLRSNRSVCVRDAVHTTNPIMWG